MKYKSLYRTLRFFGYAIAVFVTGRIIANYTPEIYDFLIGFFAGVGWILLAFAIETKFFPEKDKETSDHVIKIQVDAQMQSSHLKKLHSRQGRYRERYKI